MIIGGLEKLSLIDFPGCIATIVFTNSCNFRCHFCYNPMLVLTAGENKVEYKEEGHSLISEDDFFLFLESRIGKIDGVVISGGEPTLQADLEEFIIKIRKLGFKIKLDTNGTNHEILKKLLDKKILDYVAMDIKAPLSKYEKIVGVKVNIENIKKSVELLMAGDLPYEFRTTLVPSLHSLEDIIKISVEIAGAKKWFLQKFKSDTNLVNNDFRNQDFFSSQDIDSILGEIKKNVPNCQIRE